MVVQIVFSLVVPMSMFVALGVFLISTASAFELTTATGDAKISGNTVFLKLDWDKSMEQVNSGDRAATSFCCRGIVFQVDCTSDIVNTLCDLSGGFGSSTLKLVILVFWRLTKDARFCFISKVCDR